MHAHTTTTALDLAKQAQKSLTRIAHPSMVGRYPDATRKRLHEATREARQAVATLESVLDAHPGRVEVDA